MQQPTETEPIQERLSNLEREEDKLWRVSLLFLTLLGTALAAAVWEQFTSTMVLILIAAVNLLGSQAAGPPSMLRFAAFLVIGWELGAQIERVSAEVPA